MVVLDEKAILPLGNQCGSWHTEQVSARIVSRSIHLASAKTKFKIYPNFTVCFSCYLWGLFHTWRLV